MVPFRRPPLFGAGSHFFKTLSPFLFFFLSNEHNVKSFASRQIFNGMAIVVGVSVNYMIEGNKYPASLVGGKISEFKSLCGASLSISFVRITRRAIAWTRVD